MPENYVIEVAQVSGKPIELVPGLLNTASPFAAWQILQDLHFLSIGERPHFAPPAAYDVDADGAFRLLSNADVTLAAQLFLAPEEARMRTLESLVEFGSHHSSLEGLESPFLSLNLGLRLPDAEDVQQHAAELWDRVGMVPQLGGGAERTLMADPASRSFSMPTLDQIHKATNPEARAAATHAAGLSDHGPLGTVLSLLHHVPVVGPLIEEARHTRVGRAVEGVLKIGAGVAAGGPAGIVAAVEGGTNIVGAISGTTHPPRTHGAAHPQTVPTPPTGMHLDTRQMQQMEWLILGATTKAVEAFGHSSHGTRASTPSASGNSSRPAPTPHIAPEGDEFEVEFKCGNATPAPIGRGRGIDAILIESQESGSSPFADLPSFDAQGSLEDPGLLGDFIDTWHRGHASERLTLKRDGERGAYLEKWDLSGGERSTDEVYVLQTRTATIVNIPRAAVERSADEALAGATYEENVAYILRELASTMKSLPVVDQI